MKARNTIDEVLAVVQAVKNGKQVQYWHSQYGNFAEDGSWQDCVSRPILNFADCIYRVKPMPKKVPLTHKDIPLDRPVWLRTASGDTDLVESVDDTGIRTWYTRYTFDTLFHKVCTISFDGGKTWQKCEKEVAE
jgi:hypothetical protein